MGVYRTARYKFAGLNLEVVVGSVGAVVIVIVAVISITSLVVFIRNLYIRKS